MQACTENIFTRLLCSIALCKYDYEYSTFVCVYYFCCSWVVTTECVKTLSKHCKSGSVNVTPKWL